MSTLLRVLWRNAYVCLSPVIGGFSENNENIHLVLLLIVATTMQFKGEKPLLSNFFDWLAEESKLHMRGVGGVLLIDLHHIGSECRLKNKIG